MGQTARTVAATSFTLDVQARRYRDLYARLIAAQVRGAKTREPCQRYQCGQLRLDLERARTGKKCTPREKNALLAEKNALVVEKNASLAREKMASIHELARQKSDARSRTISSQTMESLSKAAITVRIRFTEHPRALALGAQTLTSPAQEASDGPILDWRNPCKLTQFGQQREKGLVDVLAENCGQSNSSSAGGRVLQRTSARRKSDSVRAISYASGVWIQQQGWTCAGNGDRELDAV